MSVRDLVAGLLEIGYRPALVERWRMRRFGRGLPKNIHSARSRREDTEITTQCLEKIRELNDAGVEPSLTDLARELGRTVGQISDAISAPRYSGRVVARKISGSYRGGGYRLALRIA